MEPVEGKAEEERCTHFTGAGEVRAVYVARLGVARLGVGDGVFLARRHGRSRMRFAHVMLDAGGRPATDGARVPSTGAWRGLCRVDGQGASRWWVGRGGGRGAACRGRGWSAGRRCACSSGRIGRLTRRVLPGQGLEFFKTLRTIMKDADKK